MKVIKKVLLGERRRTGRTRHLRAGEPIPEPAELRIAHYEGEPGFYLLQFDKDGNELTDTLHDTAEDAMAQADWEYSIKPGEWRTSSGDTP